MEVKRVPTHLHSDIENVCLTIAQVSPGQQHIGFLFYSLINEKVKFLHLAWHERLQYDNPPPPKYIWVDIPFDDPYNQENFQLFLDTIFDLNGTGINYGISIDGIEINTDGSLLLESKHAGLTCATFVMRALHAQGYDVVDLDNWEHRVEDIVWQEDILKNLLYYATPEYIESQKTQIGTIRFKPEEIAVATISDNRPLNTEDAYEPSQALLKILVEHNKTLLT